ncbi:hypothetical protein HRbin07_00639 [bacterium HR07]|nr:hypothetical protein HRbin07_00639 [bacterium HR07]
MLSERVERVKPLVVPQTRQQRNFKLYTVQLFVGIEEMDFNTGAGIRKCGSAPDIEHAVALRIFDTDPHGIDPRRRHEHMRIERQVRRGIAQLSSAPVAVDDRAPQRRRIAQHLAGFLKAPRR